MQPAAASADEAMDYATQLADAQRELQNLNYAISHDLRAPVRAIIGFGQALQDHAAQSLDETGLHLLARMEQAAQKLGAMIDGLLQLSRLAQTELQVMQVDIGALCVTLVDALRVQYPTHNVQVTIADDMHALCDAQLVRVALAAMLHNAWKYTQDRNDARIHINLIREPTTATLCVRDNGIGFDINYAQRLFVPFQHLQSRHELNGVGIGLANVQRVASRHRGRAWAQAVLNEYAAFYLSLPQVMPVATS